MKYYRLWKYTNSAVGADFAYCTDENKAQYEGEYCDLEEEISLDEYEEGIERNKRRAFRMIAG